MKFALQTDTPSPHGPQFWRGLLQQLRNRVRAVREAASAASQAPLARKGARRINIYNSEGELVRTRLVGAPDASKTVGRITEPEVPLDSFMDDLDRKQRLRSVMPHAEDEIHRPSRTGIVGDVLGKILDDDEKCFDDDGREIDCATGEPIEEVKRTVAKRRGSVAESAVNVFRETYGMAQQFGPPSEAPEGLSGQDLGKYLDRKGKKLPPDDPAVNLRYSGAQPPVPGARCGSCVYFDSEMSSCAIVSNPVTPALVCSMWTPRKGEGDAVQTFADEMQK